MYKIAVAPGDGVGPEVTSEALKVLERVCNKHRIEYCTEFVDIGGCSIDKYGVPLTDEYLETCKYSDAVLLGSVGGSKWNKLDDEIRPEKALLKLRSSLEASINMRPAKLYKELMSICPLKDSILAKGADILIVRELSGGIYFRQSGSGSDSFGIYSFDTELYYEYEIINIVRSAFEFSLSRRRKVCLVDKSNVLCSSKLWLKIFNDIAREYPDVETQHLYVDNASIQLIKKPFDFDVVVTSNIFGDILSDEISVIAGSIGMLPSASISRKYASIYEPIHGSAPDIAGKGIVNPIGSILSVSMLMRYSMNCEEAANDIEKATETVIKKGFTTFDISGGSASYITTKEMGDRITDEI